jgi:hypothetical protein
MDSTQFEGQGRDHQLPHTPMAKPTWRRGQEGDTAVRIVVSPEPPARDVELPLGTSKDEKSPPLKRSYFQAFDALTAQDAALAQIGYDHDLPHDFPVKRPEKKRKDSIRDDSSTRTSVANDVPSAASSSPPVAATEVAKPPSIVLTTEEAAAAISESKAAQVPKELEIDGNAGFDPHWADNGDQQPKRTYLYKGKRYEVQGDEPEEWLKDVREVPSQTSRASVSSVQARRHSKSSAAPRKGTPSGVAGRTRESPRRGSVRPDYGGERRKSRRHLG